MPTFDDVTAIHETEKAILCEWDGEKHWVPKSQIRNESEVQGVGDEGSLVVTDWWASIAKVG